MTNERQIGDCLPIEATGTGFRPEANRSWNRTVLGLRPPPGEGCVIASVAALGQRPLL